MEFVKEYAAGADFPAELSYSCYFWTENGLYGMAARRKQLHRCSDGNSAVISLSREYIKIVPNAREKDFFAYAQLPNKNEIAVYRLDSSFRELDCQKVRKLEGCFCAVDMWFDSLRNFLFLVYPKAILKYNCNGDCLGIFMNAPSETVYCSMCTFENNLFLAYKRNNCPYVGLYCSDGSFIEQISLGREYQIFGMQVISNKNNSSLMLHVIKKEKIPLFCELNFQNANSSEGMFRSACIRETPAKEEIELEMALESGIGEATCHIKPHCHTLLPIT